MSSGPQRSLDSAVPSPSPLRGGVEAAGRFICAELEAWCELVSGAVRRGGSTLDHQ